MKRDTESASLLPYLAGDDECICQIHSGYVMEDSFWADLNSSNPLSTAKKGLTVNHKRSIKLRSGHS